MAIQTLADDIRLGVLNFSCASDGLLPKNSPFKTETIEQFVVKSSAPRRKGELLFQASKVGGLLLLDDLGAAGDELVNAFNKRQSKNGKVSFASQFEFGRCGNIHSSEEFLAKKPAMMADLVKLFTEATWDVQVFLNPYFLDGEEIPDLHTILVRLNARVPLFRPDGTPEVRWQRDDAGEKVGDAPFPLKPSGVLRIQDEGICVVDE